MRRDKFCSHLTFTINKKDVEHHRRHRKYEKSPMDIPTYQLDLLVRLTDIEFKVTEMSLRIKRVVNTINLFLFFFIY